MALPIIGALAGLIRVLGTVGSVSLRTAMAGVRGGASVARGVRGASRLSKIGTIGGQLAANPLLYPLRGAQQATAAAGGMIGRGGSAVARGAQQAFSGMLRSAFTRPAAATAAQTPVGTVATPMQTVASGYAPPQHAQQPPGAGGGGGSGGGGGGGGGVGGGGGGGGTQPNGRPTSASDMIGKIVSLAAGFGVLIVATKKLADMQIEGQRHLGEFNGKIARAFANMEVRDMQRQMRSGANTADSTSALISAFDDLQDAIQPLADGMTNLFNAAITPIIKVATTLTNALVKIGEKLGWLDPQKAPQPSPWQQSVIDLARVSRDQNRRPKFNK